jgi:hypothetical protein
VKVSSSRLMTPYERRRMLHFRMGGSVLGWLASNMMVIVLLKHYDLNWKLEIPVFVVTTLMTLFEFMFYRSRLRRSSAAAFITQGE